MRLPRLAIENYQFVVVLVFLMLSTGLISFFAMPRAEDPILEFPGYVVTAVYPGTSPEDLEELVVDPLEASLKELEDIDKIVTTVQDGVAIISVEAEYGVDVKKKYDEVLRQVNAVQNDLPEGLYQLNVRQFSPLGVKIFQLAFVSEGASYAKMEAYAETLGDMIDRIKGVRDIEITAYPQQEIRIELDAPKMAQLGIPLKQVIGTLQSNHQNIPAGEVALGEYVFSIKSSGAYKEQKQLEKTVISSRNGKIIYLGDIARIYKGYADQQYLARFNGQPTLWFNITQKKGVNVIQLSERIRKEITEFKQELPEDIRLETAFEQAPGVKSRINDFFSNLLQGIALVGIVIFLFLGIRNSLIVMTVIPTSIVIAIFLLDLNEIALQQISIAGLVIALGLLVDNGIVVIENIHRYLKEGHELVDAAIKGTTEVGWALVSATATTVLAFFPMTQLGGGTGEFIKSLPLIVVFSLLASLLLALAFTPLLAGKWLKKPAPENQGTLITRAMDKVIQNGFRPLLKSSLRYPWLVVLASLGLLAGSGFLFPYVGISFFPSADKPMIMIDINGPKGTSLESTNDAVKYVESVLDTIDYVLDYSANVGRGNPRVYYNVIPESYKKHHGQVLVRVKEWDRKRYDALIERLSAQFAQYPGARISLAEFMNGPPYEAPIEIKILGKDLDSLNYWAGQLEALIARHPGTRNVENALRLPKTDVLVDIHRDKAALLGVQLAEIDLAVRTALNGTKIGVVNSQGGEEYDLVVRLPRSDQRLWDTYQQIYVSSVTGAQIPLKQLAQLRFISGPSQVDHFDLQRAAVVTADLKKGFSSTSVTPELMAQMNEMKLPSGYEFYVAGEYETQQESFGDLGQMLIVAILGIFAVLILQFKSFRQPLIVFSAIPPAFTGSVIALFCSGWSFSFMAFVGFTSLVGIVVNTSIILVDYTNQLRQGGMDLREAIMTATETRFTPIFLTSLTTIGGLLPLTLSGGGLWAPLGWTIIGGMISSTLLSLLLVPVLYQWFK